MFPRELTIRLKLGITAKEQICTRLLFCVKTIAQRNQLSEVQVCCVNKDLLFSKL